MGLMKGWCTVSAAVSFDMQAWLRGESSFQPEPSESKSTRFYGIYRTKKGLRSFIVKSRQAAPVEAIEVRVTSSGDASILAKNLLNDYDLGRYRPTSVGLVGHHADGGRVHTAVCVGIDHDECLLLFLTSHPQWNPYARLITRDEAGFTGFAYNTVTYLAPVLRPIESMSWTERRFPDHRVKDLRQEFFPEERIGAISRL